MVFQIIPSKTEKPGERSGSLVFVKKSSKEPSFDTAEYCGAAVEIKSGFTQDDIVNFSCSSFRLDLSTSRYSVPVNKIMLEVPCYAKMSTTSITSSCTGGGGSSSSA